MARFTNYATLSYTGGTTQSNTVVGELVETLSATKAAVWEVYGAGGRVTYVVSLVNSGTAAMTGLTLTDDLGGYAFGGGTVYPLAYVNGTVRYYVNGVQQAAPTVTAGPPMTVTGLSVPAGGSAQIIYETRATAYAPLGQEATVTNTVTVTGPGILTPVTAQATVANEVGLDMQIAKALSPVMVQENGQLTYTFVIRNSGALAATAADQLVLRDTFDPRLRNLTVTADGTAWTAGTNYTYDAATGVFASLPGQLLVPAATFTQNTDGTWTTTPGTVTVTVTGTV